MIRSSIFFYTQILLSHEISEYEHHITRVRKLWNKKTLDTLKSPTSEIDNLLGLTNSQLVSLELTSAFYLVTNQMAKETFVLTPQIKSPTLSRTSHQGAIKSHDKSKVKLRVNRTVNVTVFYFEG